MGRKKKRSFQRMRRLSMHLVVIKGENGGEKKKRDGRGLEFGCR